MTTRQQPATEAGRALVRRLDRSWVAVYPNATAGSYRDAILAIEDEARAQGAAQEREIRDAALRLVFAQEAVRAAAGEKA